MKSLAAVGAKFRNVLDRRDPVYPGWCRRGAVELRRLARRHYFKSRPPVLRQLLLQGLLFYWPVRVFMLARHLLGTAGVSVRDRTGLSLGRQFCEQLYYALVYFISPLDYYRYDLFLSGKEAWMSRYLSDWEVVTLLNYCNGFSYPAAIADKCLFAERCLDSGLPTVAILAVFGHGREMPDIDLPQCDLFAKPAQGYGGRGASRWKFLAVDHYQEQGQASVSAGTLLNIISERARNEPWLLQPCIKNHPDIAPLTNGTLAVVRLVTGPSGVLGAMFKMPVGNAITSTIGLACAIDLETGYLAKLARSFRYACPGFSRHPNTGARFSDYTLPFWKEVLALALRGQRHFPEARYIGWDIAITETGPVLLEGNHNWDPSTIQRVLGPVVADWFRGDALISKNWR